MLKGKKDEVSMPIVESLNEINFSVAFNIKKIKTVFHLDLVSVKMTNIIEI
jgi:hypothetical protein